MSMESTYSTYEWYWFLVEFTISEYAVATPGYVPPMASWRSRRVIVFMLSRDADERIGHDGI